MTASPDRAQPAGGLANRSGPGDLDVVIYSARKWARLALSRNPTVLLVPFVPDQDVVFRSQAGAELTSNAHRFVPRLAAARFLGYLHVSGALAEPAQGARCIACGCGLALVRVCAR